MNPVIFLTDLQIQAFNLTTDTQIGWAVMASLGIMLGCIMALSVLIVYALGGHKQ